MPLITTGELLRSLPGVAALNVITLEHAEGVVAGAEAAGLPAILQLSQNAVRYHSGDPAPLAAALRAIASSARVPVALHLDHIEDEELLYRTEEIGFSSAMFDASQLDYVDNVAATRAATEWAHARGLHLEAELGAIGGKGNAHTPGVRTAPDEAARFVEETDVDSLAVAVGSEHAMTERTASVDLDLISRLKDAVTVPLVLHGSSGLPDESLRSAVDHGIAKVNIGTLLNISFTRKVRAALQEQPALTDPRKYLAPARQAIADVAQHMTTLISSPTEHRGRG